MAKKDNYVEMKEPLYWMGLCDRGINMKVFRWEYGCTIKAEDGSTRFVTKSKMRVEELTKQGGEYKYVLYSHKPIEVQEFLKLCLEDQNKVLADKKESLLQTEKFINFIEANIASPYYVGNYTFNTNTVYTILVSQRINGGDPKIYVDGTFASLAKTHDRMRELKAKAVETFNSIKDDIKGTVAQVNGDFPSSFKIFEIDNYENNHINIRITEQKVG